MTMRSRATLLARSVLMIAGLAIAGAAAGQADENVFADDELGFSITKPHDWHFWSRADWAYSIEMLYGVEMASDATIPVVTISKLDEPLPDLNTAISVQVLPLDAPLDISVADFLGMMMDFPPDHFIDLSIVRPPLNVFLSGRPAASMRITYGLRLVTGEIIPAVEEIWIVQGEHYLYTLNVGAKQDSSTGTLEEALAILDSIVIRN